MLMSSSPNPVGVLVAGARAVRRRINHPMKLLALAFAAIVPLFSGCMTATVIHDARHPKPTDNAPWANYLLLPLTIPGDIATSPIQIPVFLTMGDRPRHNTVLIKGADDGQGGAKPNNGTEATGYESRTRSPDSPPR